MGVKSKVSVSDLRHAHEKWQAKLKGGYAPIASGALVCDAGPDYMSNLRALPFAETHEEPAASPHEVRYGRNVRDDDLAEYYRNAHTTKKTRASIEKRAAQKRRRRKVRKAA